MSEDIDLRIVSDKPPGRGSLRRLRDAVTQRGWTGAMQGVL
ncbi:MAG: hypothetical protein WCB44_23185 [Stellaceae bacterium]